MAFNGQLLFLVHICATTCAHFLVKDIEPSMQKTLDLEADMSKVKIDLTDMKERLGNLEKEREPASSVPRTPATTKTTSCPDGWLPFQGSCYYFGHTKVNFTEAQNYCNKQGAHLVHIETEAENTFLKEFMLNYLKDRYIWIGITDDKKEGVWTLTGLETVAPFYDWGKGEPNDDGGREDCVLAISQWQYKWNDGLCSSIFDLLCEKKGK